MFIHARRREKGWLKCIMWHTHSSALVHLRMHSVLLYYDEGVVAYINEAALLVTTPNSLLSHLHHMYRMWCICACVHVCVYVRSVYHQ